MTLNNVIDRIGLICTSHKQIRTFNKGLEQDCQVDHTIKYPYAYLIDQGGSVSTAVNGQATLNYRLKLMDLANVSEDSKQNEQDVQSDMFSVMLDIIAQMNSSVFNDWKLSTSNQVQLFVEEDGDGVAGVYLDFSVTIIFTQNICEIPSELILATGPGGTVLGAPQDFKLVFDKIYVADGTEGKNLSTSGASPDLPELNGMKLLFVTRSNQTIFKVSNLPESDEYTWDGNDITLGADTSPNEKFLFLYRKN